MTPVQNWLATITQLTAAIATRWPALTPDLDDISHPPTPDQLGRATGGLAQQIATLHPLAQSCTNPGSGLRSPDLTGSGGSKGGVNRPTENTALNHLGRQQLTTSRADALRNDATHALRLALSTEDDTERRQHIHDAKADLTDALGHLQKLIPPSTTLTRLQPTGDPGCASCRRTGTYSPTIRGANGRCSWCYKWFLANGQHPPIELLKDHHDGKRITNRRASEVDRIQRERDKARQRSQPKRRRKTRR